MRNDLISIIMPVYQAQQWLKDSVDSVLCQTYQNYELLLIDDASTDASGKLCDELALRNSQICAFHQSKRGGVSCARNRGLAEANGEYILFLDCDDSLSENTLETLILKMKETDVDILFFNYSRCYASGEQKNLCEDIQEGLYQCVEIKQVFKKLFEYRIANNIGTKLYKKEILENIKFDEEANIYEDIRFCLAATQRAKSIYFLNEYFYKYECKNMDSLNSVYNEDYFVNLCKFLRELNEFEKDTPEFEYWYAQTVMSRMRDAVKIAKKNMNKFKEDFKIICSNTDVQRSKKVFKQNAYKGISLKDKIQYTVMWNQLYLGGLFLWR